MQVRVAEKMGMCFGVRDALRTMRGVENPHEITIHGELVHNPVVLQELRLRGFEQSSETDRSPQANTPRVMITAHGISDRERQRLLQQGKELIDTTCILVEKVHQTAQQLQAEGYLIALVGKADHVEVRGIVEDLTRVQVVPGPSAAAELPAERIAVLSQTTVPPEQFAATYQAIVDANPAAREVRMVDTICAPTRARQTALEALLGEVEMMIVVGGQHSNNTRALTRKCQAHGLPTYQVENAAELHAEWFRGREEAVVGLTAGTSTLPETIAEVEAWLRQFPAGAGQSAAMTTVLTSL